MKPSWDDYFLGIAEAASRRSSCEHRQVGAVVVAPGEPGRPPRAVGLGYNDSPAGDPGCEGCPRRTAGLPSGAPFHGAGVCIALHAEENALLYTDRADRVGATVYITHSPCEGCLKLIRGAGIARVVWPEGEYTL